MRHNLTLHPACVCDAVSRIDVAVSRPTETMLQLTYSLRGASAQIVMPTAAAPRRTDELWRHTCFEAFVALPAGSGYVEINLSPSTQWAAYSFTGYRTGMQPVGDEDCIAIDVLHDRPLQISARIDLARLSLPLAAHYRMGLSAVIEEVGGRLSYWALVHAGDKPDFHQHESICLTLSDESVR